MNDDTPRLDRLGYALLAATQADLTPHKRKRARSRRTLAAVLVAAVAVPGAAVAGNAIFSEEDVAASLPAGTLVLAGTEPKCTVVEDQVEYRCTLTRAPHDETAPEDSEGTIAHARSLQDIIATRDSGGRVTLSRARRGGIAPVDFTGTVEPTVGADKHVNGGCRALDAAGLTWECYLGEAAVDQKIIGPDFLGEYAPSPGVG